ncbi:Serine protease, subtilisin family [Frankineae bacterium MT45]|nr:Serine protease, subtilisin family [Frankineae bacterium MT45]
MRLCSAKSATALLATIAMGGAGLVAVALAPPADAVGATQNVIVLLRDQHTDKPATQAGMSRRAAAVGADQAPLRQRIGKLGGKTTKTYKTLNAVAATLPSSAVAALQSDPAVAEVVPDLQWKLSAAGEKAVKAAAGTATPAQSICPTDPSKPLLEPEALALTHTDSDNAQTPTARSLGYDGTGVKVGFIADGLDINQPDFIRADGSHVITDYQDFSGDGTNAPTSGGEAFGDASSIAAQGRETYDISTFMNPAHPLPAGCNIRVEGMAPGASMVALKVFSNALLTAPTSTIIQAIDWAVNVDHVDILNESFGSNPYPDNATDPISAFNHDAVDAGVTVIASTGDAGGGNTIGTAATDPWVIGAGASTAEQIYAQQTAYGFQLGNGKYTSNQLSSLSSGGISQTQRVQDLTAPGDLNWSLCSDRTLPSGDPQYDCFDNKGDPSNLEVFGGTSESAPLTSGAAALVVQAYRKTHQGASPTPQQVRQVLDSSADDLGLPADLQGSGLLNSYRAVQLAASLGTATNTGQNLLLDQTQLNGVAGPEGTITKQFKVTNDGVGTQRVSAVLRNVSTQTASQQKTVNLSASAPTHTFVDAIGITRSYVTTTFKVAPGVDRLASTVSWNGPGQIVRLSLLDPQGTFSGYSLPQGTGNFGRVELHSPAPGTWTAIIWTAATSAGYTGPATLTTTSYQAGSAGQVSPSSFSLAAGQSRTLTVTTHSPRTTTAASSLVLTGAFGQTTTASIVTRTVLALQAGRPTTFDGTFTTANGRDFSPAQTKTYLFSVPRGAAGLDFKIKVAGATPNEVVAHLSDPSGEPLSTVVNAAADGTTGTGIEATRANPTPGIWELTLELVNPVLGTQLPENYSGIASLSTTPVFTSGVPNSSNAVISKQNGSTQTITIHNTGPQDQTYFVDPRGTSQQTFPLVATEAASSDQFTASIALPLPSESVPGWLVPTEGSKLVVGASATDPITFDVMPLDSPTALNAPNNPDIESTTGTGATAVHTASPIASALWAAFPSLIGPAPADGSPVGSVSMQATILARTFYGDYTSSTGDPLLATVSTSAPAATPVTVPAGGSATVTLHLKPSGSVGSLQQGTIFVDTLQPFAAAGTSGFADEVASVPFTFRVGA